MRAGARVWLMDIVTTNDGKIIQIPKARGGRGGRGMAAPPKSTSYPARLQKKPKKRNIHEKWWKYSVKKMANGVKCDDVMCSAGGRWCLGPAGTAPCTWPAASLSPHHFCLSFPFYPPSSFSNWHLHPLCPFYFFF